MLKRDLNRTPLTTSKLIIGPSGRPLKDSLENLREAKYHQDLENHMEDSVESSILKDEDLIDYPSYPPSPRRFIEGQNPSLIVPGFFKLNDFSEISLLTGDADFGMLMEESFSPLNVVKVNYPQYGTKLLPDDAPLDLSCLLKNEKLLAAPNMSIDYQEDEEEKLMINILNYELLETPKVQKSNQILNFLYRLFHCGEMSMTEVYQRYPWTELLPQKNGTDFKNEANYTISDDDIKYSKKGSYNIDLVNGIELRDFKTRK